MKCFLLLCVFSCTVMADNKTSLFLEQISGTLSSLTGLRFKRTSNGGASNLGEMGRQLQQLAEQTTITCSNLKAEVQKMAADCSRSSQGMKTLGVGLVKLHGAMTGDLKNMDLHKLTAELAEASRQLKTQGQPVTATCDSCDEYLKRKLSECIV